MDNQPVFAFAAWSCRERNGTALIALPEFAYERPEVESQTEWLKERGAEYHGLVLRPETRPLLLSLCTPYRPLQDRAARRPEDSSFASATSESLRVRRPALARSV